MSVPFDGSSSSGSKSSDETVHEPTPHSPPAIRTGDDEVRFRLAVSFAQVAGTPPLTGRDASLSVQDDPVAGLALMPASPLHPSVPTKSSSSSSPRRAPTSSGAALLDALASINPDLLLAMVEDYPAMKEQVAKIPGLEEENVGLRETIEAQGQEIGALHAKNAQQDQEITTLQADKVILEDKLDQVDTVLSTSELMKGLSKCPSSVARLPDELA